MKHADIKNAALSRPEVEAEYKALEPEFALLRQMIAARTNAGLSQAEVVTRMGTHTPAVTRLESTLGSGSILHQQYSETIRGRCGMRSGNQIRSRTVNPTNRTGEAALFASDRSRTTDIPATVVTSTSTDLRLVRRLNGDQYRNSTDVDVRRTDPIGTTRENQQAASWGEAKQRSSFGSW